MRSARIFAVLNLLPAYVLGAGCYILPSRFWPLDSAVIALVCVLVATSVVAFARPALAHRALRFAALTLLVIGLGVCAMFALTAAFLYSVHGSYGDLGAILMSLVLLLIVPYSLAYPSLLLLWLAKNRAPSPVAQLASGPQ
ncbi:MAG TPA: hypothetical protein VFQ61_37500 [Polyangiaceae bacterium]|nr:hypothetical protein [Polyangiaceae bacterium]